MTRALMVSRALPDASVLRAPTNAYRVARADSILPEYADDTDD